VTPIEKHHICKEQLQRSYLIVSQYIPIMAENYNDNNNNNKNDNNDNNNNNDNNDNNDNNERGFLGGVIDYFATPIRDTARTNRQNLIDQNIRQNQNQREQA
jgi:hypothetical protein